MNVVHKTHALYFYIVLFLELDSDHCAYILHEKMHLEIFHVVLRRKESHMGLKHLEGEYMMTNCSILGD